MLQPSETARGAEDRIDRGDFDEIYLLGLPACAASAQRSSLLHVTVGPLYDIRGTP